MPPRPAASGTAPLVIGTSGVVAVVLLGLVIQALGNGPLAVDTWWHDLMLGWRTDTGLAIAWALDRVGGTVWMIVIGTVIVIGFLIARRPWAAAVAVAATLISQAITGVLKVSFARPRPADSLANDAMTAFPSGHTSFAATVVIVLALLLHTQIAWVLAVIWVAVMGWSRTYLAAHWLTDVAGGAVLGASVALLCWAIIVELHQAIERRASVRAWPHP